VTVPLSDSEQRILEEIEKNLYADDPAFARGVRRKAPHFAQFHRLRLGIFSLVAGIGLLVWFLLSGNLIFGVLAFAAMVVGIVLAMRSFSTIAIRGRSRTPRLRDRTTSAVKQWEERFRNRYKRL
jgi:ABC-type nickel/cobalt efflux system permease component RcnA